MSPRNVITLSVEQAPKAPEQALPSAYAAPAAYPVGKATELIQGTWRSGGPRDGHNFWCIYPR